MKAENLQHNRLMRLAASAVMALALLCSKSTYTMDRNPEQPLPPIADFATSATTGDAPLTVQFTDKSINATTWNWNFGDCSSSTLKSPSHTFSSAGSYIVTETINNSVGSAFKAITITVSDEILSPPPPASPGPSPTEPTVKAYGAPWRWFDLDNLNIGTDPNNCHGLYISYRFRADHTGQVDAGRFYLQVKQSGYAKGNGGIIRCELQTDDGTSNHFPSGQVLAYFQIDQPQMASGGKNGLFNLIAFNTVASLTAGQLYHLVFTNTSPDPKNNWYDINNICNQPRTPIQAAVSDTDYATLRKISNSSSWALDTRVRSDTPMFTLYYTDGYSLGQAYMQVYSNDPWKIQGNTKVRETFTVSGGDKIIKKMHVALWKKADSNPGALTLRLEKSDGTLIEQGIIPASSVPSGDRTSIDWVSYTLNSTALLNDGITYNFVVSAPAGDAYNVLPMMKGSTYGFAGWEFKDGWIEKNTGSGWIPGVPEAGWKGKQFDMMFYFE